MPEGKESTFSLNRGDTRSYERSLSSVKCQQGKIIVSDGTENKQLAGGETRVPVGTSILLTGLESSNVLVTLAERTI